MDSKIAKALQNRPTATMALPVEIADTGSLGVDVAKRITQIDEVQIRSYRLSRTREELRKLDVAGALLCDPFNIRYVTGTRNMTIWTLYSPGRYAFIATEGPVVLFEFETCQHLVRGNEGVDELRTGTSMFYFLAGSREKERTLHWASEIKALMREHGGENSRLAVDRIYPWAAAELTAGGIRLEDAQIALEQARRIKCDGEIESHRLSMEVCDLGVERIRRSLRPGLTENQVWAILHQTNIAHDGEFIDCRLLSSGPRTNPWFQECSNRLINAGEMLALDTDMIGPMGAMSDISRSYVVPGLAPTAAQREIYSLAEEQLAHNIDLLRPGLSFHEFADKSWSVPQRFYGNRYMTLVHGVGLCDEWPAVLYSGDQQRVGYDGLFEENMIVSAEAYIGAEDGAEGVKLEQQVLITQRGAAPFSKMPTSGALEIR